MYNLHCFPNDDILVAARPRGLPVGNLTSQFWANVYLNELDQFVKHQLRCKGYLRYVDDFLLFANNKITLHNWRDEIILFLESLRLTIHAKRAQPRPVRQGLNFLGFIVYPSHRLLKRCKGIAYRKRLRGLYQAFQTGKISQKKLNASIMAWLGHVRHGDTFALRKKLLQEILI